MRVCRVKGSGLRQLQVQLSALQAEKAKGHFEQTDSNVSREQCTAKYLYVFSKFPLLGPSRRNLRITPHRNPRAY